MRVVRNMLIGLTAIFAVAAVISFIANFDRIESTTFALGMAAVGCGILGYILTMLGRRREH